MTDLTSTLLKLLNLQSLIALMEAVALLSFAVSGLIEARKKRLDAVGMFIVAFATTFGGGTLRDILLDRRPFYWVAHQEYTIAVFVLALLAQPTLKLLSRVMSARVLVVTDAIGLGLFSIAGCSLALEAGWPPFSAAMIGVVSAVFGGVIRDVLCAEMPLILRDNKPYATCSFIGCWVYIALQRVDMPPLVSLVVGSLTILVARLLVLRLNVTLPR